MIFVLAGLGLVQEHDGLMWMLTDVCVYKPNSPYAHLEGELRFSLYSSLG